MKEPFVFGVPLVGQAASRDWQEVDALLDRTLRSVRAQDDEDFIVLLAGHEQPPAWSRHAARDTRLRWLAADWPALPPTPANDDGGRKKWLIKAELRRFGGGLLMFLDADDLVDRRLVSTCRREITRAHAGGLICGGVALDHRTGRAAAFPLRGIFDGPFHALCGSSTVARVSPYSPDPAARDPHAAFGSHHEWAQSARRLGLRLARLAVMGGYVVGTASSHSENDGPFAAWRREVAAEVRRRGEPLTAEMAERLGLQTAGEEVSAS